MFSPKHKKIVFILLFVALGFLAMQFKFTQIIGSSLKFSLFDFYGPIVGGFLGSFIGMITVLAMQVVNWAWQGFATDAATAIRFFPMLFAVLYFSKKSKLTLIAPVIAMFGFWAHPEGLKAWYYALYWLIPVAMYFLHDKFIFARALGTTFTAHAVGSVLWIWIFNMKAAVWISLIPVVWKERGLMALGITLTFIIFNYLLSLVDKKIELRELVKLNPKYSVK